LNLFFQIAIITIDPMVELLTQMAEKQPTGIGEIIVLL
jgi:hypothetical protein